MGLGQLGYNAHDLYDLTPRMFYNAQLGLYEKWDTEGRGQWERARWMACIIVGPHVKKNLQPKDITKFPWERKEAKSKKEAAQIYKEAELFQKIMHKKMKK